MESKTEYQIEYPSGRVIRIELDGLFIQVFDHSSDCELRKKSRKMHLDELVKLLPRED